jgi:hypothetical protein
MTARPARSPLYRFLAASALLAALTACSGEPDPAAGGDARSGGSATGALPPPPVSGLGSRDADPASPEPRPDANTIRWTTASEVDNYGFDVYRGDSASGPFQRLTAQPIPGAGTSDTPSRYEYVDDAIEPGREYYYYVESIGAGGDRSRFTPVRRAPPKPGPAPAEGVVSAAEGEPEQ